MQKLKPWLVLDIDNVLSRTTLFWIEELQKKFWNNEWLTAHEIKEKYFYAQRVPYEERKSDEALEIKQERLKSDEVQLSLKQIEWSQESIQKIIEHGTEISCYLSARPESVLESTTERLSKNWYPSRSIFLRPKEVAHGDAGTRKAEFLYKHKEIIWIVDDDPWLIKHLPSNYHGTVYLFETKEFENPNGIRVEQCDDWEIVTSRFII